jgi:hypothetical protein
VGVSALVAVAAGSGATAATLITGAQIKDGSVTGVDIENGSIRSVDVAGGYFSKSASDSRYLRRANPPAAFAGDRSSGSLSGDPTTKASVAFTAKSAGVAVVTVQSEFAADTAGTWVDGLLYRNGAYVQDWYWDAGDVDDFYDLTQSRTIVVPVSAGPQTFQLRMSEENNAVIANYAEYRNAQVVVVFLPFAPSPSTATSVDDQPTNE